MEPQSSILTERHSPGTSLAGLRVLIDARKLRDGGIGVYTENLINGLLSHQHSTGIELTVIGNPETVAAFNWGNTVSVIEDHAQPYSLDELVWLPRRLDFNRFDLFHAPHYTLPWGINIPTVVTVHDLIHIYHPEKRYYPFVANYLIKSALKRATKVLAVSVATYLEVKRFTRANAAIMSKMSVIPNAIDPSFLDQSLLKSSTTGKLKVTGNYLLAVISMLKPHKGLKDLLEAFKALKAQKGCGDLKLVLVGKGTERMIASEQLLEEAGSIKGVHLFGSVARDELLHLYRGAKALVVASRAEGFCLPVLEAQAVGTPVIARPVPAIMELLTNRDLACSDFSVKSLFETLASFIEQEGLEKPKCNGIIDSKHLRRFDRDELAKAIMTVYEQAVSD